MKYVCFICSLIVFSLSKILYTQSNNSLEHDLPEIAKWYGNHKCAVSLRFDDNLDSHVNFVVPVLNKFDIKATFMVNPGRNNWLISYNKNKDFWETKLPKMGHRLGNHTWHHKGAKNLEEAEFEIGEASKLLWSLYPNESKLNVFASGGGETWGGQMWHKASLEYKKIVKKYYLIDLYDGTHNTDDLNSDFSWEQIEKKINNAIEKRTHLPLLFHKVGSKSVIDFMRKLITGYNYTFDEELFLKIVKYLDSERSQIWIAPLIQILKYEKQFLVSRLANIEKSKNSIKFNIMVETEPSLYDQELTLILPIIDGSFPKKIFQNKNELIIYKRDNSYLCNIRPMSTYISIYYD